MYIDPKDVVADYEYEIFRVGRIDISHTPRPRWVYIVSVNGYEAFELSEDEYLLIEQIAEKLGKALDKEDNKRRLVRVSFGDFTK